MDGYRFQYNSDALRRAVANLHEATTNLLPAWQDVGEYMVEATKERFRTGIGPDGAAWAPKSQTTIAAYLARGDGSHTKPLIGPTRRLSSEINYGASNEGVAVGLSLIYALVQQLGARKGEFGTTSKGAPIPWGNIPARPFLGVDRDDEVSIVEIFEEYLRSAAGETP